MGSWMIIGIVYLIVLSMTNRDRLRATEQVFLEEDPEELRAGDRGPALSPGWGGPPDTMHAGTGEEPPEEDRPPAAPTDPIAPPS
jgi:hypothetical protein